MSRGSPSPRAAADRVLRGALGRLRGSGPVLVPEYPLQLQARWGWNGAQPLVAVEALLAERSGDYEDTVEAVRSMLGWARTIPRVSSAADRPCWENDWWGTVDALVQCAALRRRDPTLYLEIGSGVSTLFARKAIEDFGLRTKIVSIDPAPRRAVDAHCDEVIRKPLQDVAPGVAERLSAGDVVFVDCSHVALMNTDATVFFLELLPRLPAGVLVGIDDIFLPWDYPPTWNRRIYAEQYLLAAFLLGGGAGFTVRFPGWWLVRASPLGGRLSEVWPVVENRFGRNATSFWLERDR